MENRTLTDSGNKSRLRYAPAMTPQDCDRVGLPVAVSVRRRLVFQLPPRPGRVTVELRLFASDGTLVKRSRYRMAPVAMDATHLPPGPYLAEFHWWNGHRDRVEQVSVSL